MEFSNEFTGIMPVSNNGMYMPRPTKGGKSAYIIKTNDARNFDKVITPLLEELITDETISQLKEEIFNNHQLSIELSLSFGMPNSSFYSCDISNYVKSTEDAIKLRLQIDDSRTCRLISEKYLITGSDQWTVKFKVKTYELDFLVEDKWQVNVKKGKR